MLILGRKPGEKVYIGDDIIIEVVEISPGKVRLGFVGPRDIPIHREEIYKSKKRQAGSESAGDQTAEEPKPA